jgi:hypothetical protein
MADAYPLSWPQGQPRASRRRASKFKTATTKAVALLRGELSRLGVTGIVVSTNVPLKSDGTIRMDREPLDPGVAVYFTRNDQQMVFACDQYEDLRDNLMAVAKTIEAMRGIERWGAGEMMDRAFSGFKALPATAGQGEDCWKVLELPPMSESRMVQLSHRDMLRKLHANGSSSEAFARINVARDDALRALAAAATI